MRRNRSQIVPTILILLVSLSSAVAVTWLVPSLSAAAVNTLFRFRGQMRPPEDILIVAIDDASLQQVGNWPWPRSVMASALERITDARPRAVGLDVVYAEASERAEDRRLTEAIRRNGSVVLPAQLTELETSQADAGGASKWLLPLPELKSAAAATGHAHANPDVDGVLRTIQLSKADDRGQRLWAFGLETLRVAERIPAEDVEELDGALRVGRYRVGIQDETEKSALGGVTIVRPNETTINYLGPPRTFPYYSIADVIQGKVPSAVFKDKIVLIGAVAQTMGDTRITPFISYGAAGRQGGAGMPGVEVHANIIETIRRGVWLNPYPGWMGFVVVLLVVLCAAFIVTTLDGRRQVVSLFALLAIIIAGSLYAFNHYSVIPPLAPMLTGFFTVVPLLLLNGSITASRDLDEKLDRLARIQKKFMSHKSWEGLVADDGDDEPEGSTLSSRPLSVNPPRNVSRKLRAVDDITAHLVARIGFMNQVLTSMTDGLLVADRDGRVVFANPAALKFWDEHEAEAVTGKSLKEMFSTRGILDEEVLRETLGGVLKGQQVLRDVELLGREGRFYTLQFSAVMAGTRQALDSESRSRGSQSPSRGVTGVVGLIVIITDVTKRRELERVKAETLQLVSHELRTPLTSIRGLSDLLIKFSVPEGESREALKTIYSEAVRMNELINLYLDVTRIESGAQTLSLSPVAANDLITDCTRAFNRPASEKGILIKLKLEEPSPSLLADRPLLTQALNNLVGNAVKYSPKGSEVEVGSRSDDAHACLYVRDEGFGIPHEFQSRVFEKFYRLERDVKSEAVGTGLGLPLVKEIVERHGGRVTLESEPDRGSTFIIHLPIRNGP